VPGFIKFEIRLPAKLEKKGKWYISSCPALDVFSQGKSKKEAMANLEEALSLFVHSCFERGVLGEVLRDGGFESAQKMPRVVGNNNKYVTVPLSLLAMQHAETRAH